MMSPEQAVTAAPEAGIHGSKHGSAEALRHTKSQGV